MSPTAGAEERWQHGVRKDSPVNWILASIAGRGRPDTGWMAMQTRLAGDCVEQPAAVSGYQEVVWSAGSACCIGSCSHDTGHRVIRHRSGPGVDGKTHMLGALFSV